MASLFVTEYEDLAHDAKGNVVMCGQEPAITTQKVTYSTSAQSAALDKRTRFVFLQTDGTKAHILFGDDPTADADDPPIPTPGGYFYGVAFGAVQDGLKIAAYDGSS